VRLTGFQPAARATDGPVIQHPQQPQQPQQQQQQQVAKVSAKGPPSSNLTIRLTVQLCSTYKKCSSALGPPQQGGVPQPLPRRILTRPAAGVKNNGWDNESCDLILATQVGSGVCWCWCVQQCDCTWEGPCSSHRFWSFDTPACAGHTLCCTLLDHGVLWCLHPASPSNNVAVCQQC
jgi:hypothetical protein